MRNTIPIEEDDIPIVINKVRSPDYPFPVIFFKKDLERIRSYVKTGEEQQSLQSLYFTIRVIASDIEEGIVKDDITPERFFDLIREDLPEADQYTDNNIISQLLILQNLGIYTIFSIKE